MQKKTKIILAGTFLLVLAALVVLVVDLPLREPVSFTGKAYAYRADDVAYKAEHDVVLDGRIVSGKTFSGKLEVSGVYTSEGGKVRAELFKAPAWGEVNFRSDDGVMSMTPFAGVTADPKEEYMILILWTEYAAGSGHFQKEKMEFICIGDIDRDTAMQVLQA